MFEAFLEFLGWTIVALGVVAVVFLVLLAMPRSPMRNWLTELVMRLMATGVAGAYAINKMMGNNGYYGSPYGNSYANPYGYGSMNPYGSPYGYGMTSPYGYGMTSPYGSPYGYPMQQSMGSSLLNTGIRALFGGGSTGYGY